MKLCGAVSDRRREVHETVGVWWHHLVQSYWNGEHPSPTLIEIACERGFVTSGGCSAVIPSSSAANALRRLQTRKSKPQRTSRKAYNAPARCRRSLQ